jgi:hypothetical protein
VRRPPRAKVEKARQVSLIGGWVAALSMCLGPVFVRVEGRVAMIFRGLGLLRFARKDRREGSEVGFESLVWDCFACARNDGRKGTQ